MALKIIDHGTNEYRQMVKLRDEMLRKPLGLGFTQEELDAEKDNMLIAAFEDEDILGCCMLVEEKADKVRLRQMASAGQARKRGGFDEAFASCSFDQRGAGVAPRGAGPCRAAESAHNGEAAEVQVPDRLRRCLEERRPAGADQDAGTAVRDRRD